MVNGNWSFRRIARWCYINHFFIRKLDKAVSIELLFFRIIVCIKCELKIISPVGKRKKFDFLVIKFTFIYVYNSVISLKNYFYFRITIWNSTSFFQNQHILSSWRGRTQRVKIKNIFCSNICRNCFPLV